MNLEGVNDSESRFDAYVEAIASVIGHADRARPLRDYCVGLIMPGERKSVEPMAAVTAPARVAAQHQSLLHFVGQSPWSDEEVLRKVREMVLPAMERREPIQAWIIDDTGIPKQGKHSVGVTPQYCGQLGRRGNCQVAVSLSIANHWASLPIAYRLYLPHEWAKDEHRRRKAHVPPEIKFKTKQEIALEQVRWACEAGLPRGVVLMDPDYGRNGKLRTDVTALGLSYVAGIQPGTLVWKPGTGPQPGRERPKWGRRGEPNIVSVKEIALGLPAKAWQTIEWREGSAERLSSWFARLRVRVAHRYAPLEGPAEEWLLIEWPEGENEPVKYWLSTLPEDISFRDLVDIAKLRWRIEPTTRSSSRRSASGTLKGADGAASITTPRYASRPTDFLSPSGRRFPPHEVPPPRTSRNLPFPIVIDPEEPPLRPERHMPNSIATMRRRLIAAILRRLPRCPCCAAPIRGYSR
jgi:SRSO17 transposase